LTDSVAVDAKRILLRYGAPIAILDKVSEAHRIEFAREIAKTLLPERESRLRQLLAEHGYMAELPAQKGKGAKKGQSAKAKGRPQPAKTKSGSRSAKTEGRSKSAKAESQARPGKSRNSKGKKKKN
jgi:hypothetical protein